MNNLVIFLPWPPTINSYYAVQGRQTRFISAKGRAFRADVESTLSEQGANGLMMDFKLNVEVTLHAPDKRVRDLDNYMKALLDACTKAGLWKDDSLIDQLFIYRGEVRRSGIVVMEVNPAGPVLPVRKASRESR